MDTAHGPYSISPVLPALIVSVCKVLYSCTTCTGSGLQGPPKHRCSTTGVPPLSFYSHIHFLFCPHPQPLEPADLPSMSKILLVHNVM